MPASFRGNGRLPTGTGALGEFRTDSYRAMGHVLLLSAVVCAAFAAAASWAVLFLLWQGAFTEPDPFPARLFLKAVFFSFCAVAGTALLRRALRSIPTAPPPSADPDSRRESIPWGLLAITVLACVLFFPNLGRFPWPAPDELHHLIVARNLAEHGAYASGLAPDHLIHFDHYDSVGAPVIAPVAVAFVILGTSLEAARLVMAGFGVLLLPLAYATLRAVYSRREALLGAVLALAAYGTIYLGRTLYGEVPAFVFLLGGLILWRRGLSSESRGIPALIAAGALFGLCVLTKTFMLVAACAFAGVYLYDRATFRRIPLRGVLVPAAGLAGVMLSWRLYEMAAGTASDQQPSTLLYYRHSLVFGWDALMQSGDRWWAWGVSVLAALFGMSYAVPRVFRDRYDPALAALFLIAPLFAFWWAFFTPHHIHRYLWYTGIIAAMFTGPLLLACLRNLRSRGAVTFQRAIPAGAAGLIILSAYAPRLAEKGWYVFSNDQAAPERALADYVANLPPEALIATTYWPAERLINFTAERPVDVISTADASAIPHDVIVHSDRVRGPEPSIGGAAQRFGHYTVYQRDRYRAAEHQKEPRQP